MTTEFNYESKITPESVSECINRLEKIKFYKKNKKYVLLTKVFLTEPSFLILAYLRIKSKFDSMVSRKNIKIFGNTHKNWFIHIANQIKNNIYKFKPVKLVWVRVLEWLKCLQNVWIIVINFLQ